MKPAFNFPPNEEEYLKERWQKPLPQPWLQDAPEEPSNEAAAAAVVAPSPAAQPESAQPTEEVRQLLQPQHLNEQQPVAGNNSSSSSSSTGKQAAAAPEKINHAPAAAAAAERQVQRLLDLMHEVKGNQTPNPYAATAASASSFHGAGTTSGRSFSEHYVAQRQEQLQHQQMNYQQPQPQQQHTQQQPQQVNGSHHDHLRHVSTNPPQRQEQQQHQGGQRSANDSHVNRSQSNGYVSSSPPKLVPPSSSSSSSAFMPVSQQSFSTAQSSAFAPLHVSKPKPQRSPPLEEPGSAAGGGAGQGMPPEGKRPASGGTTEVKAAAARAALESASARRQESADRQLERIIQAARHENSSSSQQGELGYLSSQSGPPTNDAVVNGGNGYWQQQPSASSSSSSFSAAPPSTSFKQPSKQPGPRPHVPLFAAQMPRADGHGSPPPPLQGGHGLNNVDDDKSRASDRESPTMWRRSPSPAPTQSYSTTRDPLLVTHRLQEQQQREPTFIQRRQGLPLQSELFVGAPPCAKCGKFPNSSSSCRHCNTSSVAVEAAASPQQRQQQQQQQRSPNAAQQVCRSDACAKRVHANKGTGYCSECEKARLSSRSSGGRAAAGLREATLWAASQNSDQHEGYLYSGSVHSQRTTGQWQGTMGRAN